MRLSHKQSRGGFIPGNAEPQLGSFISSKKHPITTNAAVFIPLKRHYEKNQIQPTGTFAAIAELGLGAPGYSLTIRYVF